MFAWVACVVVLFVCTVLPLPTHAQYDVPGFSGTLTISSDPSSPAPGESVRLSAQSFIMDLQSSVVTWYVDGVKKESGQGKTSVLVTVPKEGTAILVRAEALGPEGVSTGSITLRGASLSIIWEASSYTPPFYRGRALPSPESTVHAQAITRFVRSGGSEIPPSDIEYMWYKNGSLLRSISGRGASTVQFDSPLLFATDVITVEAVSADHAFSATASVRIKSVEPTLELYESHPLYGIVWERAIGTNTTVYDTQATFITSPLFAAATSPIHRSLVYEWSVDGKSLPSDPDAPNEVRITAPEGGGGSVGLNLSLAGSLFGDASKSWSFLFVPNATKQARPFGLETQ